MCISFIYRDPNADRNSYRLIVASNRDEFFSRPALAAHYWEQYPTCLGGIDIEPGKEGGTWLALSTKGKAGIILNLRDGTKFLQTPKKGRGNLVKDFVTSDQSTDSYLHNLHKENQDNQSYNAYNLVLIELYNANVYYLSSSKRSTGPTICHDNILGFGNSEVEYPYTKVKVGKELFKNIVHDAKTSMQDDLVKQLMVFLKSREKHLPDTELQKKYPSMFQELSSIYVSTPEYGTRTNSILLVNGLGEATFIENTLMSDHKWKQQTFNIKLNERK